MTAEKLAQELPTGSRCRTRPHLRGDGLVRPDNTVFAKPQAEMSPYSLGDMVTKAGWASSEKSLNDTLARACSNELNSAKSN